MYMKMTLLFKENIDVIKLVYEIMRKTEHKYKFEK